MDFSSHKSLFSLILCLFLGCCLSGCTSALSSPQPIPTAATLPKETNTAQPTPLPGPTATAVSPACSETTGTVSTVLVPSQLAKKPTELKVYTPPCYSSAGIKKYPVLYMLHGQTYTDTQWIDLGLISKADNLISSGTIMPMIIVLPNEADSMSFADTSTFGDVMINEVLPWVDENYSVCAQKSCRAIGGLSRGGNWAVRIGLSHPELFAAIGAHSAPLFYGDLERVKNWTAAVSDDESLPMIYIDFGKSDEDRASMIQFDEELTSLGVVHQMLQFNGFHDADYWSAHVKDYLNWYSEAFAAAG